MVESNHGRILVAGRCMQVQWFTSQFDLKDPNDFVIARIAVRMLSSGGDQEQNAHQCNWCHGAVTVCVSPDASNISKLVRHWQGEPIRG